MTHSDGGSGSVLVIAVIASITLVAAITIPLYRGVVVLGSAQTAADAAALAGADVAVGIAPGSPCSVATAIASANGARATGCAVDGDVVTVATAHSFLGFELAARATAGPPVGYRIRR